MHIVTADGFVGSWRVVACERRSANGVEYLHYSLRCALCGNMAAILVRVWGNREENPTVAPCDCTSAKGEHK